MNALFKFSNKNCFALIYQMCSYFVRSEPLFKQTLFFTGKIKFKFLHFQLHLHVFNSSFFIHVFIFSFFKSEFFFNLFLFYFFLHFYFSQFYSINPIIANQFQIIFSHNLLINNTVTDFKF